MGDIHFSQGDGEITFCGAIEMAVTSICGVNIIKGGMKKYGIVNPIFQPSPVEPNYNRYLIFEGISVDEKGKQHYLDVHVAYRRACLNAIEYLKNSVYTGEQAYAILGTAPVQGHISGIVDIPNACATLYVPSEIFKFDILPNANGPKKNGHWPKWIWPRPNSKLKNQMAIDEWIAGRVTGSSVPQPASFVNRRSTTS